MNIGEVMKSPVETLSTKSSILVATRLMKDKGIKHLPVLDESGRLTGVVTDRDLKRASASDASTLEIHELFYLLDKVLIDDVMTKNPICIASDDKAQQAAYLMVTNRIGCLPVVDGDQLVGIITKDDLLQVLAKMA